MLLISNADVAKVLTVEDAMGLIAETAADYAAGDAICVPRTDVILDRAEEGSHYSYRSTPGASNRHGMVAVRIQSDVLTRQKQGEFETEEKHAGKPGLYFGLIWLFSAETGEPLALIHSGELQHTRAAARNGLSAKYLAREDARVLAMIGSGAMARATARSIAGVRALEEVRVFSPTASHREAFASEMTDLLKVKVRAVSSAEEGVRGADMVSLCTDSVRPVIPREWLAPGMHVTQTSGPEIDFDPQDVFDTVLWFAEDPVPLGHDKPLGKVVQFAPPSSHAATRGRRRGEVSSPKHARVITLAGVVAGKAQTRLSDAEMTFSGSSSGEGGIQGLGFIALAPHVYAEAARLGLGRELPTEWFLQDVRD